MRLTSAKFNRAWLRCWLLSAAHSIIRLCSVLWSSADMLAKLRERASHFLFWPMLSVFQCTLSASGPAAARR
jgi:hypothetical protein